MPLLTEAERTGAMSSLPEWSYDASRQGLAREFRFADFSEAFAFMTRVALEAEKADHHPDWFNAWDRVAILLTTHRDGGVTDKDVALAKRIDVIAG